MTSSSSIQIATTPDQISQQKLTLAATFPKYAEVMAAASIEYHSFVIEVLREQGLNDENSPTVCQIESKLLNVMGSAMFQRDKKSEVSDELAAIKRLGDGDVTNIKQLIIGILNQKVEEREPAVKFGINDEKVIAIAEKWAQSTALLASDIDTLKKEQGANERRAHGQELAEKANQKNQTPPAFIAIPSVVVGVAVGVLFGIKFFKSNHP